MRPASAPTLEAVRVAVAREWENERRVAARTETYRKAREHYIVVDRGEAGATGRGQVMSVLARLLVAARGGIRHRLCPPSPTSFARPTCNCARSTPTPTTCCGKFRRSTRRPRSTCVPPFRTAPGRSRPLRKSFATGASVQRWRIAVDGGLAGKAIAFQGLPASPIDVLVRVERTDGTVQLGRVLPVEPQFVRDGQPRSRSRSCGRIPCLASSTS